jgi:hypothetical protein
LETQILLAGDLDLIEKGELGTLKKDIAEIERMLKALIKSLENKSLNPWILFSNLFGEEPILVTFKSYSISGSQA